MASATSLRERINSLAMDFEVSHPMLTDALNRITNQLASLGI